MKRFLLAWLILLPWISDAAERPNILVFLVDDMGVMDTSVPFLSDEKGKPERHPLNDFYRTPNMERLAKQGIRFSDFYAMSVCSPSRVSLMTGQTSARHHTTQFIRPESNNAGEFGARNWRWEGLSQDQITLPALLAKAGYRTIHAGKAHLGPNDSFAENPENLGFEVNIGGCSYGQPGSYYGTENFGHGKKGREHRAVPGLEKYHGREVHLTEALTREMNAAIADAVKDGKPFFAHMSHYAVHTPFQADPRFIANYPDASKPLAAFATLIEGMDKSLGDILDQLASLGVAENTLVLFLGDNGSDAPIGGEHEISCSAPLRGKKATHYEGGMRVPFIAAWAKPKEAHALQKRTPIARNALTRQLGAIYDLFPTVLAVAEAGRSPTKTDGIDLQPHLTGKGKPVERDFLMHFPHTHRSSYFTSYRKGDLKLVYHYRDTAHKKWGPVELFDLSTDPSESNNLATSQPRQLKEMMAAMMVSLEDAGAQYPLADDGKSHLFPAIHR